MQDPNQNIEKKAQIHRIQSDLAILDSDLMKVERTLEELNARLRGNKHKKDQLELDIEEDEKERRKLEGEQMILVVEIKKLKRKMNLLTVSTISKTPQ